MTPTPAALKAAQEIRARATVEFHGPHQGDDELADIIDRHAGQWQPIETAPRDGTRVRLLCPGNRECCGHWHAMHFGHVGWHVDIPCLGGWGVGSDSCIHWPEDEPTHWMLLPTPPENAEVRHGTKDQNA